MSAIRRISFFLGACLVAEGSGIATGVPAPAKVVTANADNFRDGWFSTETVLTPANVSAGSFGKLFTWSLSGGRIMAQPLIVPQVNTSAGSKDLMIVVGQAGVISAFDANNFSATPVWTVTLASGNQYTDPLLYNEVVACLSTPVADAAGGFLYAVCASSSGPTWTLYKFNLATGSQISSVAISGQYPGTGDPNGGDTIIGGQLQFKAFTHVQRAALTLANGNVYIGFGSNADSHPWHGWAFAYNATTLSRVAVFCTSPSDYGAGLWGAGSGFSVDQSGNLYVLTGNGGYDGSTAFGESILRFSSTLSLSDWFTPSDWATMEGDDSDMSSSRAMLMPTLNGSPLLVGGAKDFNLYSVNSTCMGHLQGSGSGCPAAQVWLTNAGTPGSHVGIYGGAYANGIVYAPNTGGNLFAYQFSGTGFNSTPIAQTASTYAFPGAYPSVSSNGALNAIVWAVTPAASAETTASAGTLHAFNSVTLAEIYNSNSIVADQMGQLNKHAPPVVWRGHVFVGSGSNVLVYGLGAH